MPETLLDPVIAHQASEASSVSIILVANQSRQVVDAEITNLEACEILWLLSLIKKYGFAAVEETLVQYLLARQNNDYTV